MPLLPPHRPNCRLARADGPLPSRTSYVSWPRPIGPLIPAASALSCVARDFTPRPSPNGANNATPELTAHWFPPGVPRTALANPLTAELTLLQRDNARLTQRLVRAEAIIDLQKKVAELLGTPLAPNDGELLTDAVVALAPDSGMTAAVVSRFGARRASVQRRRARLTAPSAIPRPRPRSARALTAPQQKIVLISRMRRTSPISAGPRSCQPARPGPLSPLDPHHVSHPRPQR